MGLCAHACRFYYTATLKKNYKDSDFELIKNTKKFAEVVKGKHADSLKDGGFSTKEKARKAYEDWVTDHFAKQRNETKVTDSHF